MSKTDFILLSDEDVAAWPDYEPPDGFETLIKGLSPKTVAALGGYVRHAFMAGRLSKNPPTIVVRKPEGNITIISTEGPGGITFDQALEKIKMLEQRNAMLEHQILEINGGFTEYLGMPCVSLRQRLSQIIRRATAKL